MSCVAAYIAKLRTRKWRKGRRRRGRKEEEEEEEEPVVHAASRAPPSATKSLSGLFLTSPYP
jgi:hypothetical protein